MLRNVKTNKKNSKIFKKGQIFKNLQGWYVEYMCEGKVAK